MLEILDCTLRDGGYYTNWDFSEHTVKNYISYVEKLPIDFIEIGYRNPLNNQVYRGEFFHLDVTKIKELKDGLKGKKIALMLDAKSVASNEVKELLLPLKGVVDLVRITVNPSKLNESIQLGEAITSEGFALAFNIMYISTGVVNESLIKEIENISFPIEYLYLVDSYGGAMPDQVSELCKMVKSSTSAKLGYHGHNNLEMALANTIAAIDAGADIVDATVLGMGRGAGNLKTELILTYLLRSGKVECDMEQLAALVDTFKELYDEFKWGPNLPYMISGALNIPQGTVMNWIRTDRYSENDIVRKVVSMNEENDLELPPLSTLNVKRVEKILMIGGGSSVSKNLTKVKRLLKENNYTVIFTSIKPLKKLAAEVDEAIICASGKQLHELGKLKDNVSQHIAHLIVPKSILGIKKEDLNGFTEKTYQLVQNSFIDKKEDSPLLLALEYARKVDADVDFIGFDGYELDDPKGMILNRVNQSIFQHYMNEGLTLRSLTNTTYNVPSSSLHAITM